MLFEVEFQTQKVKRELALGPYEKLPMAVYDKTYYEIH